MKNIWTGESNAKDTVIQSYTLGNKEKSNNTVRVKRIQKMNGMEYNELVKSFAMKKKKKNVVVGLGGGKRISKHKYIETPVGVSVPGTIIATENPIIYREQLITPYIEKYDEENPYLSDELNKKNEVMIDEEEEVNPYLKKVPWLDDGGGRESSKSYNRFPTIQKLEVSPTINQQKEEQKRIDYEKRICGEIGRQTMECFLNVGKTFCGNQVNVNPSSELSTKPTIRNLICGIGDGLVKSTTYKKPIIVNHLRKLVEHEIVSFKREIRNQYAAKKGRLYEPIMEDRVPFDIELPLHNMDDFSYGAFDVNLMKFDQSMENVLKSAKNKIVRKVGRGYSNIFTYSIPCLSVEEVESFCREVDFTHKVNGVCVESVCSNVHMDGEEDRSFLGNPYNGCIASLLTGGTPFMSMVLCKNFIRKVNKEGTPVMPYIKHGERTPCLLCTYKFQELRFYESKSMSGNPPGYSVQEYGIVTGLPIVDGRFRSFTDDAALPITEEFNGLTNASLFIDNDHFILSEKHTMQKFGRRPLLGLLIKEDYVFPISSSKSLSKREGYYSSNRSGYYSTTVDSVNAWKLLLVKLNILNSRKYRKNDVDMYLKRIKTIFTS